MAAHAEHIEHSGPHIASVSNYLTIFSLLLILTAATVGVALMDLGIFNTVAALMIACVKAMLVILYYMHLKFSPSQIKLAAAAAIFWLMIMLTITAFDYVGRTWQHVPAGW